MAEYTEGPWIAKRDVCHFDSLSTVEAGGTTDKWPNTRMIVQIGGSAGGAEQEANTRLIAAAPELLEKLKELVDVCDGHYRELTEECQAVIARAEASDV